VNCQSLINDFLHDYHAGTLSAGRKVQFELHLSLCRDCRRYVSSYRKTVALAKRAAESPAAGPPRELVDAILKITRRA
jgi:anti-sigma factor RsiW